MSPRLPIVFILLTVLLDSMGIGLMMPVMPSLIREIVGTNLSQAAVWGGILSTAFAVMQFLFGPTVGNLSDRYGRRPVLLVALFVMSLDYIVMAVAGSIWLLFAGRIVGGITAATHSTASAYMADISKPEEKAANFGLIGAAFGFGFVLGPVIGGLLAGFGTRAPFYAAAALACTNMLFGYFVLPETVTDRIRRPFSWRRANPLGAFSAIGQLPGLRRMLVILLIYGIAFFVYPAVWVYFGELRFGWSPSMVGVSLGAFGIGMAVTQAIIIRPVLRRFGERRTALIGFAFNIAAFAFLGLVENGWVALAATPIAALGGLSGPALQGIMSRSVGDDQQGELQGLLTSVNAVGTIIAPLLMTQIFRYFTDTSNAVFLPGAPFLLSSALVLVCYLLFLTMRQPAERAA